MSLDISLDPSILNYADSLEQKEPLQDVNSSSLQSRVSLQAAVLENSTPKEDVFFDALDISPITAFTAEEDEVFFDALDHITPLDLQSINSREKLIAFLKNPAILQRILTRAQTIANEPLTSEKIRKGFGILQLRKNIVEPLYLLNDTEIMKIEKQWKCRHGEHLVWMKYRIMRSPEASEILEDSWNIIKKEVVPLAMQQPVVQYINEMFHTTFTFSFDIKPFNLGGQCAGMVTYFMFLMHVINQEFGQPISEDLLRAITTEFKEGGAEQVFILQEMFGSTEFIQFKPIIGLLPKTKAGNPIVTRLDVIHTPFEKMSDCVNLPQGIYELELDGACHTTILGIIETFINGAVEKKYYWFDPNGGLYKVDILKLGDLIAREYTKCTGVNIIQYDFDLNRETHTACVLKKLWQLAAKLNFF